MNPTIGDTTIIRFRGKSGDIVERELESDNGKQHLDWLDKYDHVSEPELVQLATVALEELRHRETCKKLSNLINKIIRELSQ